MRCKNLSEAFSKITDSKRNFYFRNVSEYKGKISIIMYKSDQLYTYGYRYFQGKILVFFNKKINLGCKKPYGHGAL